MASPKYRRASHVIFDMDDLLLNTEDIYTSAFQNICSPHKKEYTWEVKVMTMGQKIATGAQIVIDQLGLPLTVAQFIEQLDVQLEELFSKSQLLPGAEKLVGHLVRHQIPVALCTGSSTKAYEAKTSHHSGFFRSFRPKVLCSDDPEVTRGKPDPDAYEVTLRRFEGAVPAPGECLVFEDSMNGVLSAVGAGMQCVMVPDERLRDERMSEATLVVKSLLDFVPEEFGLPAY